MGNSLPFGFGETVGFMPRHALVLIRFQTASWREAEIELILALIGLWHSKDYEHLPPIVDYFCSHRLLFFLTSPSHIAQRPIIICVPFGGWGANMQPGWQGG
jgi:hypothetical protein